MEVDAMDEYDIRSSFEVLDEDKSNRITLKNFHSLYLGLGYEPKQLTLQQLGEKVIAAIDVRRERSNNNSRAVWNAEDADLFDADISSNNGDDEGFLPLSLVLEILSQHRRDRTSEIHRCFQLLDNCGRGYVTAEDLQRLSNEVGEPLSSAEAEILMPDPLGPDTFPKRVFSPPSP